MEIHGIRPELQPAALAKASENKANDNVKKEEAVGTNHDAPGIVQEHDSSEVIIGSLINIKG